jgi:hypothetical protein
LLLQPRCKCPLLKWEQVTDQHFYSGGGRIIAVNLTTAFAAVDETVEQGEGTNHVQVWDGDRDVLHPQRDQVTHYYRFRNSNLVGGIAGEIHHDQGHR